MISTGNTISNFIETQLPQFVNREGPAFVKFVKTYYEWLEQFENPVVISRKLSEYKDVDKIPEKYFSFMRNEFMKDIPATVGDERLLLKNIVDFYRSRGTEKSFRMLFRMMYGDDDISFYYPGKDILRVSDGRWVVQRKADLTLNVPTSFMENVVSIRGGVSKATARKDNFVSYIENSISKNTVYLTNIFGEFLPDETVFDTTSNTLIGTLSANGVVSLPGRYNGTNGFLSWDKYLQDNYYYQEFSYQINTNRNLIDYKDVVTSLVHPAGTKMFGSIYVISSIDMSQFLDVATVNSSSVVGGKEYISITYEIIADGIDQDIDIGSAFGSWTEHANTNSVFVFTADQLQGWLNGEISLLFDLTISSTMHTRWLFSETLEFTFDDWTPLLINNTFYTFAEKVVAENILLTSTVYPTDNVTVPYKYYTL